MSRESPRAWIRFEPGQSVDLALRCLELLAEQSLPAGDLVDWILRAYLGFAMSDTHKPFSSGQTLTVRRFARRVTAIIR